MRYLLIFFLVGFQVFSNEIGIWKDYYCYNGAKKVFYQNNQTYCVTNNGLFSYSNNNELFLYNKLNFTSDYGINNLAFGSNTLIISYENSNIDIIEGDLTTSISDIKNLEIAGKKVNNLIVIDNNLFISASYGISKINLINKEISDTYYLYKNGESLEINDLKKIDDYYLAATNKGVFKSEQNSLLNDPNNWIQIDTNSNVSKIVNGSRTVFLYQNGFTTNYKVSEDLSNISSILINANSLNDITYSNNKFLFVYDNSVVTSINGIDTLEIYYDDSKQTKFESACYDDNDNIWIADSINGLIKLNNGIIELNILPNGPSSNNVFDLNFSNSKLFMSHGGHSNYNVNNLNYQGVSVLENNSWTKYSSQFLGNSRDIVSSVANSDYEYFASWYDGVSEISNNSLSNKFGYNNTNGILDTTYYSNNRVQISDLKFDSYGNLWGLNSQVQKPLFVKTPKNEWYSYTLNLSIEGLYFDEILIDNTSQKWGIIAKGNGKGLFVYDDNNTLDNQYDDQYKLITTNIGQGALPNNNVNCITKDRNGEIWVGTYEGICVFNNPSLVFSGYNFDAQQILITEGDYGQYLLSSESVKCIAIDGGNRKWVGTLGAGLYLLSTDGTEEIHHFTSENSPLPSNNIIDIAINSKNGEVFIGTDKGLMSYTSDATVGESSQSNLKIFPNPVRQSYSGLITIDKLYTGANIKITDMNFNLIYEGFANGGRATWNGRDIDGNKVPTGVYLIFTSGDMGDEKISGKILIIK
ncbi:MAG: hypothetical protein CMP71_01470 [Flavobacteriales bacterium]|nr:hypothetical protein [Flavobacteriales bacterium]